MKRRKVDRDLVRKIMSVAQCTYNAASKRLINFQRGVITEEELYRNRNKPSLKKETLPNELPNDNVPSVDAQLCSKELFIGRMWSVLSKVKKFDESSIDVLYDAVEQEELVADKYNNALIEMLNLLETAQCIGLLNKSEELQQSTKRVEIEEIDQQTSTTQKTAEEEFFLSFESLSKLSKASIFKALKANPSNIVKFIHIYRLCKALYVMLKHDVKTSSHCNQSTALTRLQKYANGHIDYDKLYEQPQFYRGRPKGSSNRRRKSSSTMN